MVYVSFVCKLAILSLWANIVCADICYDRKDEFQQKIVEQLRDVQLKAHVVFGLECFHQYRNSKNIVVSFVPPNSFEAIDGVFVPEFGSIEGQLKVARNYVPRGSSLAVPYTKGNYLLSEPEKIKKLFSEYGFSANLIELEKNQPLINFIKQTSNDSVVILIPDSAFSSPKIIQALLLSFYRRGLPVIGYSRAITKMGAFASPDVTSEALSASIVRAQEFPSGHTKFLWSETTQTVNLVVQKSLSGT